MAYKQLTTPVVEGKVTRVSADAVTEERTGQTYFLANHQSGEQTVPKSYPNRTSEALVGPTDAWVLRKRCSALILTWWVAGSVTPSAQAVKRRPPSDHDES